MTGKIIAALLVLSATAITNANPASAEGRGFRSGGFHGGGVGSLDGRRSHGRGFHRHHNRGIVLGGFGYDYGNGYGDWYGISSGYDACPLFRQSVMTRSGPRIRMIPVC